MVKEYLQVSGNTHRRETDAFPCEQEVKEHPQVVQAEETTVAGSG